MQKTEIKILFLVTLFSFLICLPVISTHAVLVDELLLFDKSQKQIIHVLIRFISIICLSLHFCN